MMQVMDIQQIGNAQNTQERYLDYVLLDHHHFEDGDCSI